MQTITISLSGYFASNYLGMGQFGNEPLWNDVPTSQNLVIDSISALVGVQKGQNANLWLSVDYPNKGSRVT